MRHTYNIGKIATMIDEKKRAEIEMAKALKKHFNEEPLKPIIQSLAYVAIKDLLKNADEEELKLYLNKTRDKGTYRFWHADRQRERFPGGQAPEAPFNQLQAISRKEWNRIRYPQAPHTKFDPPDCSDLLRLYAEFIEGCGEGEYERSKKKYTKTKKGLIFKDRIWSHVEWMKDRRKIRGERKIKRRDRRGVGKILFPKKDDYVVDQSDVATQWQGIPPDMQRDAFSAKKYFKYDPEKESDRQYLDRVYREAADLDDKKVRVRRQNIPSETDEMERILLEDLGIDSEPGPKAGMQFWKLMPQSSILEIDRMFGLKEIGSDISGTTADTVGALEALYTDLLSVDQNGIIRPIIGQTHLGQELSPAQVTENLLLLRPLIALLPLATMVSLGHHTTLECAFPLSINDYIDYSMGYYTSLFPPEWYKITGTINELRYEPNLRYKPRGTSVKFHDVVENAAVAIWMTLRKYETDKRNHKMMIYYSQEGEIRGAFIIEKREEKRFRNATTLSKNITTYLYWFYTTKGFRYPAFPLMCETSEKHELVRELRQAYFEDEDLDFNGEDVDFEEDDGEREDKYDLSDDEEVELKVEEDVGEAWDALMGKKK
jgi:hypothetical protein